MRAYTSDSGYVTVLVKAYHKWMRKEPLVGFEQRAIESYGWLFSLNADDWKHLIDPRYTNWSNPGMLMFLQDVYRACFDTDYTPVR